MKPRAGKLATTESVSVPGVVADEESEDGALGLRRRSHGHADLGKLDLELGEPVAVAHDDLVPDVLRDDVRVHRDGRHKVEEDVVALGLLGHWVGVGHLKLVERLQQEPLALVLEVLKGGLGRDEVGMPNDGPDEEPVVRDLPAPVDLGPPEVEVHLVVGDRDGVQVIVLQPVQLQLEGECRLEVPEDHVLLEVVPRPEGEVLGELVGPQHHERDPPDELLPEELDVLPAEGVEHGADVGVIDGAGNLDGDVDDVRGFPALVVGVGEPLAAVVLIIVRVGAACHVKRERRVVAVPGAVCLTQSPS